MRDPKPSPKAHLVQMKRGLLPAPGKTLLEDSRLVPLSESPIALFVLPSDALGWGTGGLGGCPWPSSWALKPQVGSLRAEPPSFFLSLSFLGQLAWLILGTWGSFPEAPSLQHRQAVGTDARAQGPGSALSLPPPWASVSVSVPLKGEGLPDPRALPSCVLLRL